MPSFLLFLLVQADLTVTGRYWSSFYQYQVPTVKFDHCPTFGGYLTPSWLSPLPFSFIHSLSHTLSHSYFSLPVLVVTVEFRPVPSANGQIWPKLTTGPLLGGCYLTPFLAASSPPLTLTHSFSLLTLFLSLLISNCN